LISEKKKKKEVNDLCDIYLRMLINGIGGVTVGVFNLSAIDGRCELWLDKTTIDDRCEL
jgi:hypothetical protein